MMHNRSIYQVDDTRLHAPSTSKRPFAGIQDIHRLLHPFYSVFLL